MNKTNATKVRLFMMATIYVLIAILLITSITFAWFTLTNENETLFVTQISGVEAEYEFYIYNDSSLSDNSNMTLINNTTTDEENYDKYYLIPDPTSNYLIPDYMAPGDVVQFALKVTNVGTTSGSLSLSLSNVLSQYYDLDVNKIQTAFLYRVPKISYINDGIETTDQKDVLNMNYNEGHFSEQDYLDYELVSYVPLGHVTNNVVVIYFEFYFDPTIYGEDAQGITYTNSNIFMGQKLSINTIYMDLSA